MSGRRLGGPRGGDQNEYLARFLLSKLGLVTAVERQEDIGFDFHCALADQEKGLLTFGSPFLVQVKSASSPVFAVMPGKSFKAKPGIVPDHLSWLLRQELPMYLGVLDPKQSMLRLYSLAPLWLIYYQVPDCAGIRFVPRKPGSGGPHIGVPTRNSRYKKFPVYDVDVGHPIAEFNIKDARKNLRLADEKARLRFCLRYEMRNLVFFRAGLPHFYWFAETNREKGPPLPAFFYRELVNDAQVMGRAMKFLGPALIPWARRFQLDQDAEALAALRVLYQRMPVEIIPDKVRAVLPEIFKP